MTIIYTPHLNHVTNTTSAQYKKCGYITITGISQIRHFQKMLPTDKLLTKTTMIQLFCLLATIYTCNQATHYCCPCTD